MEDTTFAFIMGVLLSDLVWIIGLLIWIYKNGGTGIGIIH